MKAILEFDLNETDDRIAHYRAIKSLDMASALHEIVYNTKKSLKNKIEFKEDGEPDAFETVDLVFNRFYEILQENNINIDELIN